MAAVEIKVPEDYSRDPVWLRIRGLELDDGISQLTFSKKLARENRWAHWFALEVIDEYKKFLYLMAQAGHPVTPSIQVDQAWQWLDMSQHIILDQKMGYLVLMIVFLFFLILGWLRPI